MWNLNQPGLAPNVTDPSQAPGASRGLLAMIKEYLGGWLGPRLGATTMTGVKVAAEQVHSGPSQVILPWFLPYFDDYTAEPAQARAAYRKMFADPNVKSALLGKLLAVGALDLKIRPAQKKNALDEEVAEFVKWTLTERIRDGFPGLVWSILSGGLVDGYSVCEKVFEQEQGGDFDKLWPLVAVKPKDVGNDLVLQTDSYRNVVSVMGLRYNAGQEFSPARFLIWRHLPLYDTPTGMSDLRAVYSRYWLLDTVLKLRGVNAEKRAIPFLMGTYTNPTQQRSLENTLALVKSQSWVTVPEGVKVEALNIAGSSDAIFEGFIRDLKHDIFMGIQGAILQALEGTVADGRGNSQVHRSTADLLVWYLAQSLQTLLNDRTNGLIKDIVDLNYVVNRYPRATLSAVDVGEMTAELDIDTKLHAMGVELSKEDMYERYNRVPPLSPEDALKKDAGGLPGMPGPGGPGGGGLPPGGSPGLDDPEGGDDLFPDDEELDDELDDDGLFDEQDLFTAPMRQFKESDWRQEEGPRGGHRWVNASGRVVYSKTNPGAGSGRPGKATASKPDAGRAAGPTRKAPDRQSVLAAIEQVKADGPTADSVRALADVVHELKTDDIQAIKKELGLRAGGSKRAMANAVAKQATARVTERESWAREARKAGVKPADLFSANTEIRRSQAEYIHDVRDMLEQTRRLYASEHGSRLTRGHKAFRGGDPASIPGFDRIAQTMADRYPALLGAHGYEGDNETDLAARRLYDFLLAGSPKMPPTKDTLAQAFEYVASSGGSRRRVEDDEPIPFAEMDAPHDLLAILLAMLDAKEAGDDDLAEVLAEMAHEPEDADDGAGDPDDEVTQEAAARVAGYLKDADFEQFAEWEESKHPRGKGGRFGRGSSGAQAKKKAKRAARREAGGGSVDHTSGPSPRKSLLRVAGSQVMSTIRKAKHKVEDVEHAVGDYLAHGVDRQIERLPAGVRQGVAATWWMTKLGTKAAFVTYTTGQKLAEEVAKESGASPEQTARIKAICTALDIAGAKAVPLALGAVGLGAAALPGSFVPAGSAAYLAYSTARRPLAVLRAARNVVKGMAETLLSKFGEADEDTIRLAIVYLAAELKKGTITRAQYGAAVSHLMGEPDKYAEEDWTNVPGPRSKNRWVHNKTGRVVYSKENPGKRKWYDADRSNRPEPSVGLEKARQLLAGAKDPEALAQALAKLHNKDLQALKKDLKVKAGGTKIAQAKVLAREALQRAMQDEDGGEQPNQQQPEQGGDDEGQRADAAGSGSTDEADAGDGGRVEEETGGPADEGADQVRVAEAEPLGPPTPRRVSAQTEAVTRKITRLEQFFRNKNQPLVADWLTGLREHVGLVGAESALSALGAKDTTAGDKGKVQYWGVGTEEMNWKNMGSFMEAYLARNGIIAVTGDTSDPNLPLVSALGAPDKYVAGEDFKPIGAHYRDKLSEAKHLPGLETSEDITKIMGKPVTHLTPEVAAALDQKYGPGQWIVKCYDDNAAAGYGIFFPQRATAIATDARNTLWDAGAKLAEYGFEQIREPSYGNFARGAGTFGNLTLDEPEDENNRWNHPEDVKAAYNAKVLDAAKQSQFYIEPDKLSHITSRHNVGGLEHEVYEDPATGRFWKLTKDGHFGQNKDISEYLARHAMANQLWPELGYTFHGVSSDHRGEARAVLSMNRVDGPQPAQDEIQEWFTSRGWVPEGDRYEDDQGNDLGQWRWKDPETGTIVGDAHAKNFVRTSTGLVPIDVDILPGPDALKNLPTDEPEKVVGLRHSEGDEYRFGTDRYRNTINGDAREWGDRAANAANHENGPMLPEGSFMAQPAFQAVGISDAERAAGKTWHEKNEGRVHLVTRPDGNVEVIPHSTWLKGGALPVVFEDEDTKAMAEAAREAISKLPMEARKGQVYAPDIMKTPEGYRVVELNAQGDYNGSGYLHDNHFTIDAFTSHLAGRTPAHVSFIRNLLTTRKDKGKSNAPAPAKQEQTAGSGKGVPQWGSWAW